MLQAGLQLEQLLIRLANTVGVQTIASDGTAALPDDAMLVDRMKMAVQDAISDMQLANPSWRCLQPAVSITLGADSPACIDGNTTRYRLPWYVVAQPGSGWAFALTNSYRGNVQSSTYARVVEWNADDRTGPPQLVAVTPGAEIGTWELHVAPRPDAAYVLSAQCSLKAFQPTQMHQRSPFGSVHDQTVLAGAKWCFVREDGDENKTQLALAEYQDKLAKSIAFDAKAAGANTVGQILDPVTFTDRRAHFWRSGGVTAIDGIATNP